MRVEQRLDGTLAVRHGEQYLAISECEVAKKPKAAEAAGGKREGNRQGGRKRRGSDWKKGFDLQKALPMWQAAQASGYRREEATE